MIEKALLKALEDREVFLKYHDLVRESSVTRETWTILTDVGQWFETNSSDSVDWNAFASWFCLVQHPSYKHDTLAVYRAVLEGLEEYKCEDTSESILQALHEREVATNAERIAASIAEGTGEYSMEDLSNSLQDFKPVIEEVRTVTDDIDELSRFLTASGLSWRLEELNVSIGPIGKGDLIGVGARPETGKTTFLASEVSWFLTQTDKDIVWFANEEAGERVRWRIIQAITNRTTEEILKDKAGTMKLYRAAGGERIRLIAAPSISFPEIRKTLSNLNPCMVIYDQLRNVRGFERSGTDVERLKALYREARALASEYGPSIAVHQARGDAEGELYPMQQQLEGTQTEVQGALDVQIMIGRSHDPVYNEDLRGINIVKNKLTGGDRSDASKRHAKWEVQIDPDRARYTGVLTNPDMEH